MEGAVNRLSVAWRPMQAVGTASRSRRRPFGNSENFPLPCKNGLSGISKTSPSNRGPRGSIKLQGEDDLYRIRVGDYRVIYTVKDEELIVLVLRVGHRREVYRD